MDTSWTSIHTCSLSPARTHACTRTHTHTHTHHLHSYQPRSHMIVLVSLTRHQRLHPELDITFAFFKLTYNIPSHPHMTSIWHTMPQVTQINKLSHDPCKYIYLISQTRRHRLQYHKMIMQTLYSIVKLYIYNWACTSKCIAWWSQCKWSP